MSGSSSATTRDNVRRTASQMPGAAVRNQLRTVLRRTVVAQTTALVLILAVATGLFFTGRALEQSVRREAESILALQELRAEIVTAQSSVRGYTLVGRPRFLEPYRAAVPAVGGKLADVRAAVEEDELARLARVEALFGEWRRRFAEPTIALVRQSRVEQAEALARTGSGKRRIDRIKAELAAVVSGEEQEIEDEERRAELLGALAIACIAALCAAVAVAGRRTLRRLNLRLTDPLRRLADASRRLGGGDLSARVEERGVEEVAELGRSFNKMADEIQELVAELRQLDEMKDRFVSAVSHELRTPLTSIKGYLEGVLEEETGPLNERQREELEIVYRNATRLQDLANDLLTLARLESGRIEMELAPLDVCELLAELRTELEPAARKQGVELRLELDGPVAVEADDLRLHQAVGKPDRERDQVHERRRAGRAAGARPRRRGGDRGCRRRRRHSRRRASAAQGALLPRIDRGQREGQRPRLVDHARDRRQPRRADGGREHGRRGLDVPDYAAGSAAGSLISAATSTSSARFGSGSCGQAQ
jgi:signal transduction histidine kinase